MFVDLPAHVHLGQPVSALGLALVPLFPRLQPTPFLDAADAVERGVLIVEERADEAVPSLSVLNVGDVPVHITEGCLLIGGLQDRVTLHPLWLEAGGVASVAVHCVEQNRWGPRPGDSQRRFRVERAQMGFRSKRLASPTTQAATWQTVADLRKRRGRADVDGSLHELRDGVSLDRLASALVLPWSASGVMVYWKHPNRSSWPLIEWFSSPVAFRGSWPSLRRTVVEAQLHRCEERGPPLDKAIAPRIQLSRVTPRIAKVAEAHVTARADAGEGPPD